MQWMRMLGHVPSAMHCTCQTPHALTRLVSGSRGQRVPAAMRVCLSESFSWVPAQLSGYTARVWASVCGLTASVWQQPAACGVVGGFGDAQGCFGIGVHSHNNSCGAFIPRRVLNERNGPIWVLQMHAVLAVCRCRTQCQLPCRPLWSSVSCSLSGRVAGCSP